MGFGLPRLIPATSRSGTDEYLIVGFEGLDAIVIDQDGDVRPVTYTDLKTKWVYARKPGVWYSTQAELEDFDDAEETDAERGEGTGDSGGGEPQGPAPQGVGLGG